MSSKPAQKFAQHELVAGRYMTSHVIGKGGMGKVVYGKHVDLQQEVAIKYLRTSSRSGGENASKRFCQEALTYASINHPNIVKLLDFERTKHGELRMVLEFVKGETLGTFLRRTGQCHPMFAIDITIQIAQGLSAAHAKSIIHRDLKPDNIMLSPLTKSRRHYHVKLLDFGIAKNLHHEGERYTAAGTVCGTPDYMSPEQARGLDIDNRSDIYSLGVLLFEMLAGRLPYVATGKQKVMSAHCWTPIPMVSDFSNYPIPTVLEDLLQCCLAKNATDRFQNVEELISALERVAEREYDQVSPTKFNALTPTGEEIRYNQHPARDLDLLQQGSSIELAATPSMVELERLREAAYSLTDVPQISLANQPAQNQNYSPLSNPHKVPLSVIINDQSAVKKSIENTMDEKPLSQRKIEIDEPQGSAKDYRVNGLPWMDMKSWLHSIWVEFQTQIADNNPKPLLGAIAFTLLIVFSLSVSLQQSQPYPDQDPFNAEVAKNVENQSEKSDFDEPSKTPYNIPSKNDRREATSYPKMDKSTNKDLNRLITQQRDRKFLAVFNRAKEAYLQGKLDEAHSTLILHKDKPTASDLLMKIKFLQAFITKAQNTSCHVFLDEDRKKVRFEISQHPIVLERIKSCETVVKVELD